MKTCNVCKELKDVTCFCKDKHRKDGLSYRCKDCASEYFRDNKEAVAKTKAEHYSNNRDSILSQKSEYYRLNKDSILKKKSKYHSSPKVQFKYYRNAVLKKYGISLDDVISMMDKQLGCCASCGKSLIDPLSKGRYHIDHKHSTGKVRGLLCSGCNTAYGQLQESGSNILALLAYHRKHS